MFHTIILLMHQVSWVGGGRVYGH